jgi:putative FmdB family regulatory protein
MPTYDYRCEGCGHQFEEMQSFSADPLTTCPKCNQDTLRRLFGTGAAILFKGSGFYETDYRSESYKSGEKKDQETQKAPEKPASESNGTASATKSDSPKTDTSAK